MGFFSGRVTCTRFRVDGAAPRQFGPEFLEQLDANAIGKQGVAAADGVEIGWIAGDHILDTRFDLAKNIINDTLHISLRIDEVKIPGELLRAYTQVELVALAAQNQSGKPTSKQRREARQNAKDRLDDEARDGRFLRRKAIPILWDAPSNELLVGTTSVTAIDRLHVLFKQTFDRDFEMLGAGRQAFGLAEATNQTRAVDDSKPTPFVPSQTTEVSWVSDETSRDFLGNEFLLWLWYYLENESDTILLSDNSEVAAMLARTLLLECPLGQMGKESISSDGPTKLPEAMRAIQTGKLPRKVGLTLVRHELQYDLTLQAETLSINAAKMPTSDEGEERARLEERVSHIRSLLETLDLTYLAFLQRRLGDAWNLELAKMKKWLKRDEKRLAS